MYFSSISKGIPTSSRNFLQKRFFRISSGISRNFSRVFFPRYFSKSFSRNFFIFFRIMHFQEIFSSETQRLYQFFSEVYLKIFWSSSIIFCWKFCKGSFRQFFRNSSRNSQGILLEVPPDSFIGIAKDFFGLFIRNSSGHASRFSPKILSAIPSKNTP